MYTQQPHPGKFEGNRSQLVAQVVYNATPDEVCSEEGFGHYALVKGRKNWYILHESDQGFVDVEYGPSGEIMPAWDRIQSEYSQFCIEMDGE